MSSLAAPPTPRRPGKKSRWPLWSRNPENRSVQVGVFATILFHLLLLLVLPHLLKFRERTFTPAKTEKTFEIELQPEEKTAPATPTPPPKPFKFVEINPDAPDNPPDKTENFGAQNQQVAQEKPTPDGKSDAPAIDGDKEKQSTAIVSGRLEKIEPRAPPTPPTPEEQPEAQEAAQATPKMAQAPLPGFEKITGDDQDNTGANIAKIPPPNTKRGEETVEGENVREVVSFNGQVVRIDAKHPQNRDKIPQRNTRPAFLRDNKLGTQNIGPVAYNAKWSEYGEYLQKLIETVQIQWERLIVQSSVYPPSGTVVAVKFRLNSEGKITDIEPDDREAPILAKRTCVSAITARAPYGAWTKEMISVLGNEQELTFTFYYSP